MYSFARKNTVKTYVEYIFKFFKKISKKLLTFVFHYNIICLASSGEAKLNNEVWLSLVERCVRDAEAAGSSPVTSTIFYSDEGIAQLVRVPA